MMIGGWATAADAQQDARAARSGRFGNSSTYREVPSFRTTPSYRVGSLQRYVPSYRLGTFERYVPSYRVPVHPLYAPPLPAGTWPADRLRYGYTGAGSVAGSRGSGGFYPVPFRATRFGGELGISTRGFSLYRSR